MAATQINIFHLQRQPLYLTVTRPWLLRVRSRLGLVSVSNIRVGKLPSSTVHSFIAWFAKSQEFLSKSICRITLKTVLESVPTRIPSSMEWGDIWEAGPGLWNSTKGPIISERMSLSLLRSKTKFFISSPRSPVCDVNWKISRNSSIKLPGSATILAVTLPETITTPPYPCISTEMKIDSLMEEGVKYIGSRSDR